MEILSRGQQSRDMSDIIIIIHSLVTVLPISISSSHTTDEMTMINNVCLGRYAIPLYYINKTINVRQLISIQ